MNLFGNNYGYDGWTGQLGPLSQYNINANGGPDVTSDQMGEPDSETGNGGGLPFLPSSNLSSYVTSPVATAGNLASSGGAGAGSGSFLNLLNSVGDLGSIFGGQARGDAQGQVFQGQLDNTGNSNLINLYRAQQDAQNQAAQLDLERQQFGTTNRGQTARQALVGALLSGGYKPTVPGAAISSGLLKSLNSNPNALAAMRTLGQQGSTAQNTPLTFTGGNLVAPPKLTPVTKIQTGALGKTGGFLQDLAGIGKVVGSALGFFGL